MITKSIWKYSGLRKSHKILEKEADGFLYYTLWFKSIITNRQNVVSTEGQKIRPLKLMEKFRIDKMSWAFPPKAETETKIQVLVLYLGKAK